MPLLELQNITTGYDNNIILKDLSFQMGKGELVPLLGSSGCDKTTALRLIAGFSSLMSGTFMFDDKGYAHVPLHKGDFGFVFQNYALLLHIIAFDNVAFGLRMREMSPEQMKKEMMDMLETVDLASFESRFPKEMSSGQRQRMALVRALVIKPDLLLLDEPLSNLDAKLQVKMQVEIRRLQQKFRITATYIIHDQEECFAISGKMAIMNKSVIGQMGAPSIIYNHLNTGFITHFVRFENFIDLTKTEETNIYRTANGQSIRVINGEVGERFRACIHPEDIQVAPAGTSIVNDIPGGTTVNTFPSERNQYNMKTGIEELGVSMDQGDVYRNGDKMTLSLAPNKIILP